MDSFFDSCIVIHYLESFMHNNELRRKCRGYIENNKDFLLCFYALKEIHGFINKKEVQYNEVIKKLKNASYRIGTDKETNILNKDEIIFTEDLFENIKNEDEKAVSHKFEEEISATRLNLRILLKRIKELVIKEDEIDKSLTNLIHEFLGKYADCKILASALQAQKDRDIFLLVSADKHFNPNEYAFIESEPRLRDYKFPKLKNLLYG